MGTIIQQSDEVSYGRLTVRAEVDENQYRDRLRWHLQRGEGWISNADSKATVALGLNMAVIGVGTALVSVDAAGVVALVQESWFSATLTCAVAISILVSLTAAAMAILPSFGRENSPGEEALYHFAVVANHADLDGFRRRYRAIDAHTDLVTLENMVWVNCRVSTAKLKRVRCSVVSFMVGQTAVVGWVLVSVLA